jgi:hypothetical protein
MDGGDMKASPFGFQTATAARARSRAVRKVRIVGFLRKGWGGKEPSCHAEKLASERSRIRMKDFIVELQVDGEGERKKGCYGDVSDGHGRQGTQQGRPEAGAGGRRRLRRGGLGPARQGDRGEGLRRAGAGRERQH